METQERTMVGLPADLSAALRNRLRDTRGPEIADKPMSLILRYLAALAAGIPDAQARRYAQALPRGRADAMTKYPSVRDFTRK